MAEVVISCKDTLAFDTFANCAVTGRFVLVDGYDVAGGGIIMAAEEPKSKITGTSFRYPGGRVKSGIFDEYFYDYNKLEIVKAEAPPPSTGWATSCPCPASAMSTPAIWTSCC